MSKKVSVARTTRPGPKLRPRYCTFCGEKCEGAVAAVMHCRGKGKGKGDSAKGTPKSLDLSQ